MGGTLPLKILKDTLQSLSHKWTVSCAFSLSKLQKKKYIIPTPLMYMLSTIIFIFNNLLLLKLQTIQHYFEITNYITIMGENIWYMIWDWRYDYFLIHTSNSYYELVILNFFFFFNSHEHNNHQIDPKM